MALDKGGEGNLVWYVAIANVNGEVALGILDQQVGSALRVGRVSTAEVLNANLHRLTWQLSEGEGGNGISGGSL